MIMTKVPISALKEPYQACVCVGVLDRPVNQTQLKKLKWVFDEIDVE